MRKLDMNKILAITPDIDYVAYSTALDYTEHVIREMENPTFNSLRYRYEDAICGVKHMFEEELEKVKS